MAQERESLRDLDAVRVDVEDLPPAAEARGLSREALRTSIEAALKAAAIPVMRQGDFQTGDPFLRVRVAATAEIRGSVVFLAEVDFVQIVFMRRNPAVTFNRAQTWSAAPRLGMTTADTLAASATEAVLGGVDEFISAFRAANTP